MGDTANHEAHQEGSRACRAQADSQLYVRKAEQTLEDRTANISRDQGDFQGNIGGEDDRGG